MLRVASGLESMIVGEDQIQGQVKDAFELAEMEGTVGPQLSVIFRTAISTGKKVRSGTNVNKGCISIGSAAVELAEDKIGSLMNKNILIIGAGETATLIAKHLIGKFPRAVFVSNRTYARAVELAWALNGKAVRFDSLDEFISDADVVICATSATHMILTKDHLLKALAFNCEERRMVIIDVSVPRNVDRNIAQLPGIELYDIDGLRGIAEKNVLKRQAEIKNAEVIITQELCALEQKIKEMQADEAISDLYIKMNAIRDRELKRALARAKSGTNMEVVMSEFAGSLTKKMLADQTEIVKEAYRSGNLDRINLIRQIFKIGVVVNVPTEQAEKAASNRRD